MYSLISALNAIGKELSKQNIDDNPYMNYFQKAYAKAIIDGKCDYRTFIWRIEKYFFEYMIKDINYYNNYRPIYF